MIAKITVSRAPHYLRAEPECSLRPAITRAMRRHRPTHAILRKAWLKIAQNYSGVRATGRSRLAHAIVRINQSKQAVILRRPLTSKDAFRRR